jgi:hypothetical protein
MKTLVLLLCSILVVLGGPPIKGPAWYRQAGSSGGGSEPRTWILNETFETNPGYDNTWSEVIGGDGVVNEDYTTALAGSQSLLISCPSSDQARLTNYFTATHSDVHCYFQVRFNTFPGTGQVWWRLQDTTPATVLSLELTASQQIRIRAGTGTAATVSAISTGTTYHFWVRYTKGTGANAFGSAGFSTDGTKPTSGNQFTSVSNGSSATDAKLVLLATTGNVTHEFIFDNVRIDDSSIGNNGE